VGERGQVVTAAIDHVAIVAAFEADVAEAKNDYVMRRIPLAHVLDAEAALRHARRRAERAARPCGACDGRGQWQETDACGNGFDVLCDPCHGTGKRAEGSAK
jgi:hypothetical protein